MIKTIVAGSLVELDEQVNTFMFNKKKNLPVRTEVYTIGDKVFHKATIFYDDSFPIEQEPQLESADNMVEPKEEKKERGALWNNRKGGISGKWKGKDVSLPDTVAHSLRELGKVKFAIDGDMCIITKNQFKKKPNHPDYVIFQIKEESA